MHRDRVEELLMFVVALGMLTFLARQDLVRDLSVLLILAFVLILLLVVRGFSWHEDRITPYDGLLVLGIFLTVIYLLSFMPVQRVPLTVPTVVFFAVFYAVMAALLARHRGWLFAATAQETMHSGLAPRNSISQPDHRSNAVPYAVSPVTPRPQRVMSLTVAPRKKSAHTQAKRPSILRRIFGRSHPSSFYHGIEPIHPMTPDEIARHGLEHDLERVKSGHAVRAQPLHVLHPVEVYHESPAHELLVALPGSNVFHDEGCPRLRSTRAGMRLLLNRKSSMLKKMAPCPKCRPKWP